MIYFDNPFEEKDKEELRVLYKDRQEAQKQGMRPRSFDPHIKQMQEKLGMTFGDAWRYTDTVFLEEIAKRYFM